MAEFDMALKLGMSHRAMMEELDYQEYLGWVDYFDRNPAGWREDMRTFYIMSSMAGGKQKPEDIFPSIQRLKQKEQEVTEEEERIRAMATFKASPFAAAFAKAHKKEK